MPGSENADSSGVFSAASRQNACGCEPYNRFTIPGHNIAKRQSQVIVRLIYKLLQKDEMYLGGEQPEKFVGEIIRRSRYTCLMTRSSRQNVLPTQLHKRTEIATIHSTANNYLNPLPNCLI